MIHKLHQLFYYTNVLGQKFYNEEDLLRNIKDAKERGLSIYDPEFNASSFGASSSVHKKKSKVGKASTRICKKEKQSTSIREAKSSKKQKEDSSRPPKRLCGLKLRTRL
ncbi:hypothetical protein Pfo_016765, partial [Paulownia fortunei]